MKHLSRAIIAVFMAILMGTLFPAQVFADTPDYISEVKVFAGSYSDAEKEGYTILSDGNKPVDINQNAGGGTGSKGNKAVYLGYKTTKEPKDAISDLALMNMKGGYSVQEYEALMETQIKSQIIPFVDDFLAAINEYRANYKSKNANNKQRAQYIYDMLNKLTDDDCGGAGLGDLLLNKTKYEMGDDAYNKLSDEEKNKHVDILTLIAQANGKATLLLYNLVTRAADTNDDTWLERFANTTYDDLIEETGQSPSQARKTLARAYDDKAQDIADMWDVFREELLSYDDAAAYIEKYDADAVQSVLDKAEKADEKALVAMAEELQEAQDKANKFLESESIVAIKEYLDSFNYEDGTLYDFFTSDSEEVADDTTLLYPMVASLTEGQLAGLDYVSLHDLISMTGVNRDGYSDEALDKLEAASVYEGVDRAIYQKGGVALTSDALRKGATTAMADNGSSISTLSIVLMVVTGVCALGFAYSVYKAASVSKYLAPEVLKEVRTAYTFGLEKGGAPAYKSYVSYLNATSKYGKIFAVGFGVAMIVLVGVTTYLTWKDMKDHYKVDFTPIPHYIVDEKDLIGYNSKGEKVILKNQSAYYKAVECNRKAGDEYYDTVGTCADMNGDVGQQWLALYAARNEMQAPILASSLKVVVNSEEIPAGYTTGIHMFGNSAAENLNNTLYDWNSNAPKVYVYFKVDESANNTAGSNFTAGTLAISGGAGIFLGAVVTALGMKVSHKRKENTTITA